MIDFTEEELEIITSLAFNAAMDCDSDLGGKYSENLSETSREVLQVHSERLLGIGKKLAGVNKNEAL